MTSPRDVLAERISQWAGDSAVYDFADRLLKDLDTAGYEVVARERMERLNERQVRMQDDHRNGYHVNLRPNDCPLCYPIAASSSEGGEG